MISPLGHACVIIGGSLDSGNGSGRHPPGEPRTHLPHQHQHRHHVAARVHNNVNVERVNFPLIQTLSLHPRPKSSLAKLHPNLLTRAEDYQDYDIAQQTVRSQIDPFSDESLDIPMLSSSQGPASQAPRLAQDVFEHEYAAPSLHLNHGLSLLGVYRGIPQSARKSPDHINSPLGRPSCRLLIIEKLLSLTKEPVWIESPKMRNA